LIRRTEKPAGRLTFFKRTCVIYASKHLSAIYSLIVVRASVESQKSSSKLAEEIRMIVDTALLHRRMVVHNAPI